jgi:hypothetical protein
MSLIQRVHIAPQLVILDGATITRPANTTAYAAGDSISNHATAGSVTELEIEGVSTRAGGVNYIAGARVETNDTGVADTFRVYLYKSDPTASTGVAAGDNAAFSNKRAGLIGTLTGEATAMSDGGIIQLMPENGTVEMPFESGDASTSLWWQLQTVDGFTPSANGTTFTLKLFVVRGFA